MYYIVARKSDHTIVEKTDRTEIDLYEYKKAIAINFGGISSDYLVYGVDSILTQRILNGHEYTIIWENDNIIGLDFSIEDNRKLFVIKTVDPNNKNIIKEHIKGDDLDSICLQFKVCLADGVTVDTSVNGETLLSVATPDNRVIYLKVIMVNGYAEDLIFKTKIEGIWYIAQKSVVINSEKLRVVPGNGPNTTRVINVLMNI